MIFYFSLGKEAPPRGLSSNDGPSKFDHCFVTSYFWGSRTYVIDLMRLGLEVRFFWIRRCSTLQYSNSFSRFHNVVTLTCLPWAWV